MSRHKRTNSADIRRLSEQELLAHFEQGLDTLTHLAATFDGGYSPIAFLMASEVQKILTENVAAQKLRGMRRFKTPYDEHGPNTLSPLYKLTMVQFGGDPPTIAFEPKFYAADSAPEVELNFRDWWGKDVIYRASAAPKGTPPGLIPVNGSPTVPYDKRETLNRMRLVNLLRNKLGSHQADEMPMLLDELDDERNWGSFTMQTQQGVLSTDDGTLLVRVRQLPAMMRQITHELLEAYGRNDPAPVAPSADEQQQ